MNDDFGILAFLSAVLAIFAFFGRVVQFVCGIVWLFSPTNREAIRKDPFWSRLFVYEGVGIVVLVVVVALIAAGMALTSHPDRNSPNQSPEPTSFTAP